MRCAGLSVGKSIGRRGRIRPAWVQRAERLARVRVANAVLGAFGMRLDDWQGASFVISGPTGRREIVDTLPQVWEMAGRMVGRAIDPLDPALIARIAERVGR